MRRVKTGPVGWHVFDRGCRRLELFRDDQDRLEFLTILKGALAFSGCVLWAYALMSNHYHLVLYGSSWELSRCMKRLNQWYSWYHNRKYGLKGAAFEGSYKAFPQKSMHLLFRLLAYVVLNPWRAGLKAYEDSWLWTSLRAYRGEVDGAPIRIEIGPVLAQLDADPLVAGERFREVMEMERAREPRKGGDPLTASEVQFMQFEWLLDCARGRMGELRGEDPVLVAAYWASMVGVPVRVVARHLGRRSETFRTLLENLRERAVADADLLRRLAPP